MHIIYTSLNLFLLWSNAYSSYKTLQLPKAGPRGGQSSRLTQNRKREMKTCLAIWVVWVSWWSCERLGDHTVGIVMPFYHEIKCVILIILLLTRTWGAEPIVLHVIRPTIKPYIPLIDVVLLWAHEAGDFFLLLACLPYNVAYDWWYGSKSAPPYEEHHRDARVLDKPEPALSNPQPFSLDTKPPAYAPPVDPLTADVPPIPSKTQMIKVVQQANEVYREIGNAQQQVRDQASTIGIQARKRSQANTTSNVPQAGPSAPNIVQFNPTKATVNTNIRPKTQVAQVQAPAIIKWHTGDLPLNLPLSRPPPQRRMPDLNTVRGQDSQPNSNIHVLGNIPVTLQQPRTEESAMPFPQPQLAAPPSLYPTIPVFETPHLPGHLAFSPVLTQPPTLPVLEDRPSISPPRPPGLLPLNLPIVIPEQLDQLPPQSQTQSQASHPPILPKPTPASAQVLHQPRAQRMTHYPNATSIPARPSAPPPVTIRRGSSDSVQGVPPPATRRGSVASRTSRQSTQDGAKEKEKPASAAATVTVAIEEGFGPALPRPRGRSAAVAMSNTRKPDPLPVVLPAAPAPVGTNKDRYAAHPTAAGSAGSRRGMLGAGRGGRGLRTKARTAREVGAAEREEVLDRPTSGSDIQHLEPADSTRSRNRSKLDIRESLGVGEEDVKQAQAVEPPVKRVRSPIQALGRFGRRTTKEIVEGKEGEAPEKPEIVAGKKRSFKETKAKGRSTFSAVTISDEEGTEYEYGGSAKKKQRLTPVVGISHDDKDEDETEDELTTPRRPFKVLLSSPRDNRPSIRPGTVHDPGVEDATTLTNPTRAAAPPKVAFSRITRNRKAGNSEPSFDLS